MVAEVVPATRQGKIWPPFLLFVSLLPPENKLESDHQRGFTFDRNTGSNALTSRGLIMAKRRNLKKEKAQRNREYARKLRQLSRSRSSRRGSGNSTGGRRDSDEE